MSDWNPSYVNWEEPGKSDKVGQIINIYGLHSNILSVSVSVALFL